MPGLPRTLHPLAWWTWAICCAVAASATTNPLWLLGLAGALTWVVTARRSDAPWADAYRFYVWGAVLIVAFRVLFRVLLAGGQGEHVILPLPRIPLPDVVAGITLLGDVTVESVLAGLYDGLRLATMLLCLGAANALANPRRLLRSLPPALHEVGTAVVVALSVFPQLGDSFVRVRRARELRPVTVGGGARRARLKGLRSTVVPVLEDAFDRSLQLAASMDARGYGRSGDRAPVQRAVTGSFMLVGLGGLCLGAYALLDQGNTPGWLATPLLGLGLGSAAVGIWLSGRGVVRTTYRPDRWRAEEVVVATSGVLCATSMLVAARTQVTVTAPSPFALDWPAMSLLTVAALGLALVPAYGSPRPPRTDGGRR